MAGPPLGSKNAANPRLFQHALRRALARLSEGENTVEAGLDRVAETLVKEAFKGTPWAVQELANRLDGKPAQAVELSGEGGGPVSLAVVFRGK